MLLIRNSSTETVKNNFSFSHTHFLTHSYRSAVIKGPYTFGGPMSQILVLKFIYLISTGYPIC